MAHMIGITEKSDIKTLWVAIASIINTDSNLSLLLEEFETKIKKEIEESGFYKRNKRKTTYEMVNSSEDTSEKIQYLMAEGYLEALKDLRRYYSNASLSKGDFNTMKNIVDTYMKAKESVNGHSN